MLSRGGEGDGTESKDERANGNRDSATHIDGFLRIIFSRSQRIFSAAGKSKSGIVSATMHFSRGGIIGASVTARFTSPLSVFSFCHHTTRSNAMYGDAALHYAESHRASATRQARSAARDAKLVTSRTGRAVQARQLAKPRK